MRTKINHLICKFCEKPFTTSKRSDTKYCSKRCHLNKLNSSRKGRNAYYVRNKEHIRAKIKARYENIKNTVEFKDKRKAYAYKYQKQRSEIDLNYKIRKKLRSRLATAISKGSKSGSAVRDLGCTIDYFKKYIESKWKPGMSWDNWTHNGWHIDHIKPLCSFDLTNHTQLKEACNYLNLQPIWKEDHLLKTTEDLKHKKPL